MAMVNTVVMLLEVVSNRGSRPTILSRQCHRQGEKVRNRTPANLTCLPPRILETLRLALRGQRPVPCEQAFANKRPRRQDPVLFDDQEPAANRKKHDPVANAQASPWARRKKVRRITPHGFTAHSIDTSLEELGTLLRNRCRIQADPLSSSFTQDTQPTQVQAQVFELMGL